MAVPGHQVGASIACFCTDFQLGRGTKMVLYDGPSSIVHWKFDQIVLHRSPK